MNMREEVYLYQIFKNIVRSLEGNVLYINWLQCERIIVLSLIFGKIAHIY